MEKRKIEYIIVAIALLLLIFASYTFFVHKYNESELIFDDITMLAPSSSNYTVSGNTIEFTNDPSFGFYDMNVTKTDSSDANVKTLLKGYLNFKGGSVDYYNESCYLVYVKFADRGHEHHALIIPVDNFNKDTLTFKENSTVWLFDGNNREFVLDSAYNSKVVI